MRQSINLRTVSPLPGGRGETGPPRPHSAPVRLVKRSHARACGGGHAGAVRRAPAGQHFHPNRVADRDCAVEQRLDAIARRGPGVAKKLDPRGRIDQNHAERLVRKLVEVALPTRPTQTPGFIDGERFRRKGSKREVDRFALGRQVVTAHDRRARRIIDIDIGT